MPFTVIDPGVDDDHWCEQEMPYVYSYPQGAVIECDICGQRWWHNKFHVWEKTNWKREDER